MVELVWFHIKGRGNIVASNYSKVSGFSGVITLGNDPAFDEVYGAGFSPMIVAHDKAIQRIPSPKRIDFHSVLFGPAPSKNEKQNTTAEPVTVAKSEPVASPPDAPANDDGASRLIDSVVDFAILVPVAHKIAVDKGWWKDGIDKRPMAEIIANYHAEVSEAWEEYRAGRMSTWYTEGTRKPEGFWVEIADLLIRIADAIGSGREHTTAHTRKLTPAIDIVSRISHAEFINYLHAWINRGEHVVSYCERFAMFNNVDLYAVVREKLRYNTSRPYRHGGKLA